MGSSGTIKLKKIWAMLDQCAPGYEKKERTHNWRVTWKGHSYDSLPVGRHGARNTVEIQIGHVRHLVRVLGIKECAEGQLEQLKH